MRFTTSVLFVVLILFRTIAFAATATLDIYWTDMEGGGGTLIVTPARQSILIDTGWPTGPSAERIHAAAMQAGIKKIDYLILTHFHIDHFGGAAGLAQLMPIGTVLDNGVPPRNPDGLFDGGAFSKIIEPYRDFACDRREIIQPGQNLDLRQADGAAAVSYRCLGAHCQFFHQPGDPLNPLRGTVADHAVDTTDNKNSIVSVIQFGLFKFFDGGDLTWNMENALVSPTNSVGKVDVYQTDHHGVNLSNNPLLLRTLAPTVSIMNNGPRKGSSKETLETLRSVPSIQTMFQVHKSLSGGLEFNTDNKFIANVPEKCTGNFIKCSVESSGDSFVISIPATGFSQRYQTQPGK